MHNQLNEKERLQKLIDKKETDYANSIYLNPVKEYIDPKRNIKEKNIFFNNSPVCIGIASEIPNKGDWFTLRLVDTPILVVRKNDKDRLVLSVDLIGQAVSAEVDAADIKAY